MNRGSLAEDPRGGLSSSSRYSRMGGETNSLLYVDSTSVRKARKAAENRMRAAGGAAKGNHNSTPKRSVGRGLADSHMDRLEVGSDGRLFHVKENRKTVSAPKTKRTKEDTHAVPASVTGAAGSVSAASAAAQENAASVSAAEAAARTTVMNPPVLQAAKPVRDYLDSEYRNPLLAVRREKAGVPAVRRFLARFRIQLIAVAAAAAVASYGYTAWHFRNRFYPGTTFFGIKAAQMSVYDVKAAVKAKVDSYSLKLIARDPEGSSSDAAVRNVITAEDIGLTYVDDGAIDRAMKSQHSWAWPVMMIAEALGGQDEELETSYDRDGLPEVMAGLPCFQKDAVIEPKNARVELTDDGAIVASEIYGTRLDEEKTEEAVRTALDTGSTQINLDKLCLYRNPTVFSGDLALINEAQALNKVLGAKITLPFGNRSEIINSEVIRTFLTKSNGAYFVDEDKVRSYVDDLAARYDTYQIARTFYTSIGTTVQLEEGVGDYGWELDREATYEAILSAVRGQSVQTLQPVYSREAYCRDANDIGDTYVEINLTTQTMWFYKEGALIVKTPVVTGNPYAGNATPDGGVWYLKSRLRNQLLSGEGYSSPVDYWMPFNRGIGIHDMQTRGWFGGTIYMGSGSHGCINTPLAAVKLIYDSIEEGTPIIVYKDESETAAELVAGPYDAVSLKSEIEETYGTVEDDGAGSIVYWTKAQKAASASAAAATSTSSSTASASTASATTGVW